MPLHYYGVDCLMLKKKKRKGKSIMVYIYDRVWYELRKRISVNHVQVFWMSNLSS